MKQIISIWMQPVYARKNAANQKVTLVLLLLLALLPTAILLMKVGGDAPGWQPLLLALALGLAFALVATLAFWFTLLVPSIATQFSPANANLVPGLKPAMRWALALPVLMFQVVMLMASLYFDHYQGIYQIWFFGVLAILSYVSTIRSKWAILVLVVISQLPLWGGSAALSIDVRTLHHPAWLTLGGLLLTAATTYWALQVHGDRHFKRHKNVLLLQSAMDGRGGQANQFSMKILNPYQFFFNRRLRQVGGAAGEATRLMPYIFGEQALWLGSFLSVAVMATGVVAYFHFFLQKSGDVKPGSSILTYMVFVVSFIMLPVIHTAVVRGAVYQTSVEQGLLSLAARIPGPATQTRLQCAFLLRQFFGLWLMVLLIVVGTLHLADVSPLLTENGIIACFSMLPLSIFYLRNYARLKTQYSSDNFLAFFQPVLLGGALSFLHAQYAEYVLASTWLLCAGVSVITLVILRWRWNQLMQFHAVFPAGRSV
ncbi:hypothetical protein [Undibacterium sp. TJN19]|uniref:hypothetical protein n=1 Tax=Undibacterium sp. TJN19 TaxID=3413055 RepID=UPI003BEFAC91